MDKNIDFEKPKGSAKITARDIAYTAVLTALVFVATFVNITLPIGAKGGLVHLGNVPLFVAALVFGRKKAAFAGAVGMALFDVLSPWFIWAPFTFVIVGLMGYVAGLVKKDGKSLPLNIVAVFLAFPIKLIGYYFAEVILYGNWVTPFMSMPGNVLQLVIGALIGIPIAATLIRKKVF
jgi:Predicted membrane protein